ncbi:MAG: carboxylating nicotinate-nucleotide diphosphorylase [Candidatus Tectimicrobiota bacterium]
MDISPFALRDLVARLLEEDIGHGDITTLGIVPPQTRGRGQFLAKEELVVAGLEVALLVFHTLDRDISMVAHVQDGTVLQPGTVFAEVSGPAQTLLSAERVALNLLQRLSGVATATRRYVEAVRHTKTHIVDTRKTTPGLRALEKYAVRVGGGHNHRFGLGDGVLIKDNHIAVAGGVAAAIQRARQAVSHLQKIEVEVEDVAQLHEALTARAEAILLDNMTPAQTREAVQIVRETPGGEQILLESSGGITLKTVHLYAEAGVDLISVGALTHSAPAVDISLEIVAEP